MSNENRGLSGSTLKLIAIILMFVDHIGATAIQNGILAEYMGADVEIGLPFSELLQIDNIQIWVIVYLLCRSIGRLAFPIFSFLLVEGFVYTSNRNKYIFRLLLFAVLSEIPFDFGLYGTLWYWDANNVFITLTIALVVLTGLEKAKDKNGLFKIIIIVLGIAVTNLLNSDFATSGVILTSMFYLFREKTRKRNIYGSITMLWGITAPLAFIIIHFYNRKRGFSLKYLFYLFYPLHLAILRFMTYLYY